MPRLRFILAGLALALAACSGGGTSSSPSSGAGTPAASGSVAATELDQAFIDMMVPHHESAVAMARLAEERAEHQELKDLAADIISAQEREIGELRAWRTQWFGSADTPPMSEMPLLPGMDMPGMDGMSGMDGMTMDMTEEIEALKTADPFDRAFIDAMVEHHGSAIDAATIIRDQTALPELKGLAEDIITSQQAEIEQMTEWRAAWYPG